MTPAEFRATLDRLQLTQSDLARQIITIGEQGEFPSVLRAVQRMATGRSRVSNEMSALVALMEKTNAAK